MKKFNMRILIISLISVITMVMILSSCTDSNEEPVTQDPISVPTKSTSTPTQPTPIPTEVLPSPQPTNYETSGFLQIVYFHRANRCSGCIWAEDATTNTLNTYFAEELENGDIEYQIINLQDDDNSDIVDKYNAHSSSLFINEVKDGTDNIEEISGIWTKLHRDDAFTELVKTSIEAHLENL